MPTSHSPHTPTSETIVYRAKAVRTMNPSLPLADTVVVRDSRILEVGWFDNVQAWLKNGTYRIDEQFRDTVLMPGFIDPHLHPGMASLMLPMHWITAMDWRLPHGDSPAVVGRKAFLARLAEVESQLPEGEPLISWGYHPLWHGEIDGATLDAISSTRPIVAWHRGFHSLWLNDAALRYAGISSEEASRHPQVHWDQRMFFESGMDLVMQRLRPYLFGEERIRRGYEQFRDVVHAGGVTQICDMAFGLCGGEQLEWDLASRMLDTPETPFRVRFVSSATNFGDQNFDAAKRFQEIEAWKARRTERLSFAHAVKMFADGGFFSALMQLKWPGRIGGEHGHWVTAPDLFKVVAEQVWNAGYVLHVHTSADLGLDLVLETLEKMQNAYPRFGLKFVIEHFGISTPEQVERIAALGAVVSANVYYVHELGERYWKDLIGYERASQMTRLGTLVRNRVRFALHSDFIAAPALPLQNAWVAVNRLSESGHVMCENERVTVEQALRAITIDAAHVIGLADEIGSIRSGKRADFTVLAEDPFEVDPMRLNKISILGTVLGGKPYMRTCGKATV